MKEPKSPADRAVESVEKGFGELFRAAKSAGRAVKQETQKHGGLTKALDDAGREVVRAASHVASRLGTELDKLGKKAQAKVDELDREVVGKPAQAASSGDDDWPKTREEYEKKYGRDGDDWPKTREEYEQKYGRPPRKRGDDDDPGFRIATPDK